MLMNLYFKLLYINNEILILKLLYKVRQNNKQVQLNEVKIDRLRIFFNLRFENCICIFSSIAKLFHM